MLYQDALDKVNLRSKHVQNGNNFHKTKTMRESVSLRMKRKKGRKFFIHFIYLWYHCSFCSSFYSSSFVSLFCCVVMKFTLLVSFYLFLSTPKYNFHHPKNYCLSCLNNIINGNPNLKTLKLVWYLHPNLWKFHWKVFLS